MIITSTHAAGSCNDCDTLREVLKNVGHPSTARFTQDSACIAFANDKEKSS